MKKPLRLGPYHVGVECGQRLWWPRSWFGRRNFLRRGKGWAAFGPIIAWRNK